eukprot:TRINITY_DN8652_c0_g1_i1.p1 TRINITY_DN8652_c0_g1~~TRINITY_DN8652_c0_g1_i1.p1  ORF type:complete len:539 (-),score=117.40 TRINITY_DN8652_c0_g1_i1:97-1713(-)
MGVLESRIVQEKIPCCGARGQLEKQAPADCELSTPCRDALAIIELISVKNAPKMDTLSESDPFVIMWVEDQDGPLCKRRHFPYRLNSHSPVWDTKRMLGHDLSAQHGGHLVLRILDFDDGLTTTLMGQDVIGDVRIPLSEIAAAKGNPITRKVSLTEEAQEALEQVPRDGPCEISIRIWKQPDFKSWPTSKWIFFVRHGESKWNQAEKNHDVVGLLETVDHSLSCTGLEQASNLAAKVLSAREKRTLDEARGWKRTFDDAPASLYEKFYSADAILASPLTRATQTALVTMQFHPKAMSLGVRLRSELREIKNLAGRDTIGQFQGADIPPHVHKELSSLYEEAQPNGDHDANALEAAFMGLTQKQQKKRTSVPVRPSMRNRIQAATPELTAAFERVARIPLDTNNTNDEWWSEVKEDTDLATERVAEFLVQMKLNPAENIIAVGHSEFIRHVCRHFLSASCIKDFPLESRALAQHRITNCGVLAVKVDFEQPVKQCITEIRLMFDTELPGDADASPTPRHSPAQLPSTPSFKARKDEAL